MTTSLIVREDFRRDGLAANFLADHTLVKMAAESLPCSKINIGYPSICSEEYKRCVEILSNTYQSSNELCVVGHARQKDLEIMARILQPHINAAGNVWLPVSDHFIDRTLHKSPDDVKTEAICLIRQWKSSCDNSIDIALADCTAKEEGLCKRVACWGKEFIDNGARNIIICDTRGYASCDNIKSLLLPFREQISRIEFHPHNDKNVALDNIKTAIELGVSCIGTSIYGASERGTMLDPRKLINQGLVFNLASFAEFEQEYKRQIGNPEDVINAVYGEGVVITGSQLRLRGQHNKYTLKFGVTSDKYITSQLLGREVHSGELSEMKDELLYKQKNIWLDSNSLTKLWARKQCKTLQ